MVVLKLAAIWFLFSCVAAPLLGFAMKRAGRDGEVEEEMRRLYAAERRRIRPRERKRSEKEVLEPAGWMRYAG
jgi:hypothetical protein